MKGHRVVSLVAWEYSNTKGEKWRMIGINLDPKISEIISLLTRFFI